MERISTFNSKEELLNFLKCINRSNTREEKFCGLLPKSVAKTIKFDDKLNMFILSSESVVDNEHGEGFYRTESYYIGAEKFLPIIEKLKAREPALIEADGFQVLVNGSWNYNSSPDDKIHLLIQSGSISGRLRLKKHVFSVYKLNFTLREVKEEIRSDTGTIKPEQVREIITSLIS